MNSNCYRIVKSKKTNAVVFIDYSKLKGFGFLPQNNIKYDGILVNKMIIIKPEFIQKVLKKKIKRKIDLYLKLVINFIDSEDSSSAEGLREALNDLTRYKSIIQYKYKKFLDEKYFKLLMKKVDLLEYELKEKYENIYTEELYMENEVRRRR